MNEFLRNNGLYLLIVFLLLGTWYGSQLSTVNNQASIPYSEFKQLVGQGDVSEVIFSGDEISAVLVRPVKLSTSIENQQRINTVTPKLGDQSLLPLLESKGVEVSVIADQSKGFAGTLVGLLPWILIIAFYFWFLRRVGGGMMGGSGPSDRYNSFLNPVSEVNDAPPETTFADVAGQENAKQEVSELLDYIRRPEDYTKLGATVPKGVLLMGPPGTGKTLLARALAGEAGVPFCSISASEFIEMFVGVGAARVRSLFKQAREKAPSILFIDELDAVGRMRGTGLGGGNDEREQTLNQILSEMDGFSGHEAVIVLAATNRPDVLDPALLRPGRFDRHVTLEMPDLEAREAILQVHTRDRPLADDVDLHEVAMETPGMSGADLRNLVNEAAMLAARNKTDHISMDDFNNTRDKVLFGSERHLVIQPEERHRLAVHEAGHTAAAFYLPGTDPIYKVTIIPRGKALGITQQLPENERYTLPKPYLQNRLVVMLAGRVAERNLLGSISSGAADDIRQATELARAMVARWGMSDDIGPVDLRDSDEHPFLGREIAKPRNYSEASARAVDAAVKTLLTEAEQAAAELIKSHKTKIVRLIDELMNKETLDKDQIVGCLLDEQNTSGLQLASISDATAPDKNQIGKKAE